MSEIVGVRPSQIGAVWEYAQPIIERACAYGPPRIGADDVYEAVSDSRMQLWLAINGKVQAACVTELINHPKARICRVFLCAGESREDWQHFIRVIEQWALENGCNSIEVPGRKGWKKVLPDYAETYCVLEKTLGTVH